MASTGKKEWVLKKECELRCELNESSTLTLRVTKGTAEIFGIELAPNKDYTFRDQNIAVFTWYGCVIETSGADSALYVADSTPMVAYMNTHIQLESRRDYALAENETGPRVIIVGQQDQGKSSLAQILAAYAVRLDRNPIFVDLDVSQGLFTIPGTMSAVPLTKTMLSPEEGYTNINPLIYFFGHTSPKENVDLYKLFVNVLAKPVKERLVRDENARSSGLIINTNNFIEGVGQEILLHCIKAFDVDVVLVMNHDKLYSYLSNALNPPTTAVGAGESNRTVVVKLPTSGGIVHRDNTIRARNRKNRIREYFYGKLQLANTLSVFTPDRREGLPLSSFIFVRAGGIQLSEGMRIIDKSTATHQETCKLLRVTPSSELLYSIVGVLHDFDGVLTSLTNTLFANTTSGGGGSSSGGASAKVIGDISQQVLQSNLAGFVNILQLDFENDRMTILSPCPGALPSNILLVGSIKWVE